MNRNQVININSALFTQILMIASLGKISNHKIHRMSCRKEATFKAIQTGYAVKASSSQLISTINVSLLPHCARNCIKTDSCKSLVYRKKPATTTEKNCQLVKVEISSLSNNDIENSVGWTYYEPLQQGTSRCQPSTCSSGYECVEQCSSSLANQYICNDINECASNPCLNGATCSNLVNYYSCTCAGGYTGTNCQTDINECASNPCLNGATCNNNINSYSCTCTGGYSGVNCQTDIDECASNPCQNAATCNDFVNSYSCTCVAGYTGTYCQSETNECQSSPCKNGGSCIDQVNSYTCKCTNPWKGTNCNMPRCESEWISDGTYCYMFSTSSHSWSTAKSSCQSHGATLATIKTEEESDFIIPKASEHYWIGASKSGSDGTYKWIDGTSLVFKKWCPNEPNNRDSVEGCVEVSSCGWNDENCLHSLRYICKKSS